MSQGIVDRDHKTGTTTERAPKTETPMEQRPEQEAAEDLAKWFHARYEALAPRFGYTTRPETRALDLTSPNGRLMVAVCKDLLKRGLPAVKRVGS